MLKHLTFAKLADFIGYTFECIKILAVLSRGKYSKACHERKLNWIKDYGWPIHFMNMEEIPERWYRVFLTDRPSYIKYLNMDFISPGFMVELISDCGVCHKRYNMDRLGSSHLAKLLVSGYLPCEFVTEKTMGKLDNIDMAKVLVARPGLHHLFPHGYRQHPRVKEALLATRPELMRGYVLTSLTSTAYVRVLISNPRLPQDLYPDWSTFTKMDWNTLLAFQPKFKKYRNPVRRLITRLRN